MGFTGYIGLGERREGESQGIEINDSGRRENFPEGPPHLGHTFDLLIFFLVGVGIYMPSCRNPKGQRQWWVDGFKGQGMHNYLGYVPID